MTTKAIADSPAVPPDQLTAAPAEPTDPSLADIPTAIEVEQVTKRFTKSTEPGKTLKERLLTLRQSKTQAFLALDNVDFNVHVGETFGILGHNGSGKSTLLKCVAGTLRPTQGTVRVRGRLSALLELGAGFHPDLTGRENIYLNGSILGLSKVKIAEIFDDVVEFSELHDFIDTQVKHYSSGMYARLGFAVAINVDPDVLLIDEVLAVGDEAFQRKCIAKVRGLQTQNRTICLVTHSPDMVRSLCDRAVVLDHGRAIYLGDANGAVAAYRRSLNKTDEPVSATGAPQQPGDPAADGPPPAPLRITRSWIARPSNGTEQFHPGERVEIRVEYEGTAGTEFKTRLLVRTHDGFVLANVTSSELQPTPQVARASGGFSFFLNNPPLMKGQYLVTLVLQSQDERTEFVRQDDALTFEVASDDPRNLRVAIDIGFEDFS